MDYRLCRACGTLTFTFTLTITCSTIICFPFFAQSFIIFFTCIFIVYLLGFYGSLFFQCATHAGILSSDVSTPPSGDASQTYGTLSYHPTLKSVKSMASVIDLIPAGLSAPFHIRPVSCYALFKGWLLLSQPPGCLCEWTSFST